ncbi:MAG: acetaldehyde dehydrogenase (acetylating) [Candidatus Altiarchaeota archaeon]|nr:acetaldehyde dehydrogenase (acetylating) [Candidatus Altiarchaeota archaeon]
MDKVKVGIIGTGNVGTDLLIKVQRSKIMECSIFTGVNPDSEGMKRAESMGVETSAESIKAIENNPRCCDIVFDATSAAIHLRHAPVLKALGKYAIDLTPSQYGRMCVPVINIAECMDESNVNLISCGGQTAVPIAHAIMKAHPETQYIEVVSSMSSMSAGPGTRENIDEFTHITKDAIISFTGVPKAKSIIILNPAEPPVLMNNTIYAKIEKPRMGELTSAITEIASRIQKYVPGYNVALGPVFENGRVTTMVKVVGLGDYLPKYSGNLDIITCAAVNVAEEYAKRKILSHGGENG